VDGAFGGRGRADAFYKGRDDCLDFDDLKHGEPSRRV
jgi:hypothetical protein